MAESLRVAISNVKVNESDAQTRIAIVLTNSFTICGDDRQSRLWFKRGHEHAVKNGDQASIDALLYNRAAFSLAWHRALACIEPIPDEALRRLRSEVDSARNLQNLTGISALGVHIRLLDARLLMLEKRYEDAAKALQAVRGDGPFGEHNFSQTFVDLEMALCNLRGGCVPTMPSLPALEALDRLDIDERIVAMWLLLQLTESGRSMAPWPDCSERLNALWLKYSQGRAELRQKLIEFEAG